MNTLSTQLVAIPPRSTKKLPGELIKRPVRKYKEALDDSEFERLISARNPKSIIGARMRAEMGLMRYAGARVSDVVSMRPHQIDFAAGKVHFVSPKGGSVYWVPLDARLAQLIREWLAVKPEAYDTVQAVDPVTGLADGQRHECEWLFPVVKEVKWQVTDAAGGKHQGYTHAGQAQSPENLLASIKKAAKDATLSKNVTCHTLRRSFGMSLRRAGVELAVISRLLNHRDTAATMHYLGIDDQDLDAAVLSTLPSGS